MTAQQPALAATAGPLRRPPFAAAIAAALEETADDGVPKLRKVVGALIERAIAGDLPAIRLLCERIDGRAPDMAPSGGKRQTLYLRWADTDRTVACACAPAPAPAAVASADPG